MRFLQRKPYEDHHRSLWRFFLQGSLKECNTHIHTYIYKFVLKCDNWQESSCNLSKSLSLCGG